MDELSLLKDADARARAYVAQNETRRVTPTTTALTALQAFDEPLPVTGHPAQETIALLDDVGSPGTVASNGPNYFGFVIGATLPAAAAAERIALAWDQSASGPIGGPSAAAIETRAAHWLLEILDLPRDAAVAFGTSATACGLSCLATARAYLLEQQGWDVATLGLSGAPDIRVIVSDTVHVTVKKALRILGFGLSLVQVVETDEFGRIDPDKLPELDDRTILCLQAGEVNTGEFDLFSEIIPRAKAAGCWVHVDGAFGLWARASNARHHLTCGIDGADSWTTDGHKWLNTPYDGAVAICRHRAALSRMMSSDAAYAPATADAQNNLTLEFSRRARGIPIWAALRSLGREGVDQLVTDHCDLAQYIGAKLSNEGFEVLNRVVLNQVLVRCSDDAKTQTVLDHAQASGKVWFGPTRWQGRLAFRISVSSWRTKKHHVDQLVETMLGAF